MKYNHKHSNGIFLAIIAVTVSVMCQNISAQPGYPPMMRMDPYHPVIRPYPPVQRVRPVYSPYMQTRVVHPVVSFSMHFDPLISWFSTNSYETRNDGVVPGFNFGISHNTYFTPNYSFSTGINIIYAGGGLINSETTSFELKNYDHGIVIVPSGEEITYRITYLSVPLGIKLQSSQMGYGRFFTDFGFDPKIVIGGRADIPSLYIKGGNALPELNTFNLSFHIMAGMEYPLSGTNSMVFGIGFENNFFDVTRDNGDQPWDVVHQKLLSFRIGITF
jgi:hypothetical protein